jgi:hypothetical protein
VVCRQPQCGINLCIGEDRSLNDLAITHRNFEQGEEPPQPVVQDRAGQPVLATTCRHATVLSPGHGVSSHTMAVSRGWLSLVQTMYLVAIVLGLCAVRGSGQTTGLCIPGDAVDADSCAAIDSAGTLDCANSTQRQLCERMCSTCSPTSTAPSASPSAAPSAAPSSHPSSAPTSTESSTDAPTTQAIPENGQSGFCVSSPTAAMNTICTARSNLFSAKALRTQ